MMNRPGMVDEEQAPIDPQQLKHLISKFIANPRKCIGDRVLLKLANSTSLHWTASEAKRLTSFEKIQKTQFPEFDDMFAEIPACLCLGHEAIDFKDSTSKKHPSSASKEHVASTADRTARQVQELRYAALHLYEFQDIPKDVAQARFTVLAERGGWKFLDLLCDLQHQLNVDITVVIRPLAEDVTCNDEEIRVAMLTLHRMDWLSTTYVRDPAANRRQTRRAVIDDQIAVFRE